MSAPTTFVHLTDLHVGNPAVQDDHLHSDTTATLRAILADVKKLSPQPDFIVASGDLTNRGDAGSYEHLKDLIAEAGLDMPILFALGNHDRRDGFYPAMLGRTSELDQPYDHSAVIGGLHVIVLDTSVPNKIGGAFEPGQLDWLLSELGSHADLPKLLVMHHAPALDTHDPSMEWESLSYADTEALRQAVTGKSVIGILSGHIHYDRVANWYGIPTVVGIGQHAATDVLWLHEGLRMLEGAAFAIGKVRPSGLSITFAPQPATRREIGGFRFADMAEILKKYEADTTVAAAE
ncbi:MULTISPECIES: metallophosphoesterase [Devosia]|uniref:3',5'-cyclic adenosine monophosphate phosphodiesterase CpdA n=1 Tax=Devosia equisanguinis TaxID=2490941 RepID=A0A447I7B9_9HYPH|nr:MULTISPECIES: metallophosphoesterase [Devosia]ODT48045.1 MAG: phosphohydrolase [Pelagibacterium sp. SCN 63-126]ODU85570.1 MAG: phosphohydrolase [Pelagibacterium sp. SCN 63-17]OJX42247.1 MAG: phosphohydrolase [Devosia sp. 63-57]VDS03287.1 3',5'-cyclic adenosine monophosphate phosphodiesterase CpdA [Devosia equisanguinis]